LQGIIHFDSNFYSDFKYNDKKDHLSFGVHSLAQFTDFLFAFIDNDSSKLQMIYHGDNRPIVFIIKQFDNEPLNDDDDECEKPVGEITTEYILYIKESFDPYDFSMNDVIQIINGFDKQAKGIEISMFTDKMKLISYKESEYSTSIDLNFNNKAFQVYQFNKKSKNTYDLKSFKAVMKNLPLAKNASLQTYSNGILKIFLNVKPLDMDKSDITIEYNLTPFVHDPE
jgi:hypothetical protein